VTGRGPGLRPTTAIAPSVLEAGPPLDSGDAVGRELGLSALSESPRQGSVVVPEEGAR
jgi:hypothetical protein